MGLVSGSFTGAGGLTAGVPTAARWIGRVVRNPCGLHTMYRRTSSTTMIEIQKRRLSLTAVLRRGSVNNCRNIEAWLGTLPARLQAPTCRSAPAVKTRGQSSRVKAKIRPKASSPEDPWAKLPASQKRRPNILSEAEVKLARTPPQWHRGITVMARMGGEYFRTNRQTADRNLSGSLHRSLIVRCGCAVAWQLAVLVALGK